MQGGLTNHIMQTMRKNGSPRTFVKKAIQRVKRRAESKKVNLETEAMQLETAVIPFISGLSQEIRRIMRTADARCVFSTPNTTRTLCSAKDHLPVENVTHAVYAIRCKTCEYVGETLRAVSVRCKEQRDMFIAGRKYMRLIGTMFKSLEGFY